MDVSAVVLHQVKTHRTLLAGAAATVALLSALAFPGIATADTLVKGSVADEAVVAGNVVVETISGNPSYASDDDPQALLDRYAEKRLREALPKSSTIITQSYPSEGALTGPNAKLFTVLKSRIETVAAATQEESTAFSIELSDLEIPTLWTKEELGVSSIVVGGEISQDAINAVQRKMPDAEKVISALLVECPYELYWYDKSKGYSFRPYGSHGVDRSDGVEKLELEGSLLIEMTPCETYAGESQYSVSGKYSNKVNVAVENADKIVRANKNRPLYLMLRAFKNAICEKAIYNQAAAQGNEKYGDAWQIVSIFSDDKEASVVCEGYAKAFQYLCDLSGSDKFNCYTVTGRMKGGAGEGPHMWNVVSMDDGHNYLVDVTNCDDGTVGYPNKLFLVHNAVGSPQGGYSFNLGGKSISYEYGEDADELDKAIDLYGETALTLSDEAYGFPGKISLAQAEVEVLGSYVYSGAPQTPSAKNVLVTLDNEVLEFGEDFTYSASNNTNAGIAKITITGVGPYKDTKTQSFSISRKPVRCPTAERNLVYTGSVQTGVNKQSSNAPYSITGNTGKNAGSYTATISLNNSGGILNYEWQHDGSGNGAADTADKKVSWSIAPRNATVTAKNASKVVGADDPQLTATISGLVDNYDIDCNLSREKGETPGVYKIIASGNADQGNYKVSFVNAKFTIVEGNKKSDKVANPMSVSLNKKKLKVKLSKVKKKKQVVSGAIVVKDAKGAVTYSRVKKGSDKKLTINKKTGKITVKKGAKRGKHKIKVKVTASGDDGHYAASKVITATIIVK